MIRVLMLLLVVVAFPAQAQMLCKKRDGVLAQLAGTYKEAPVAMGLASNGTVLELLVSDEGTFTILMTHPNGFSCFMVTGEGWQDVQRMAMDPES